MRKNFILTIVACLSLNVFSQTRSQSEEWLNKTLIIDTSTGEHIYGSLNASFGNNNSENFLNEEIYPFLWQKIYSKHTLNHGRYAQRALDDGYIIAGRTLVSGTTDFDGWIIKTDRQGNIIWDKTYGDYYVDELEMIKTISDNAYLAIGTTTMFGNSGEGWVLKVDENGEIIWNKGFHPPLSTNWDFLYDIIELEDGNYVAVGFGNSSSTQAWIIKISKQGQIIWNYEFGDEYWERLTSVKATSDGGFIAVGDKHMQHGTTVAHDGYIVKFDSQGNIVWEKTYGGEKNEVFRFITTNADGSYTITGSKTNETTNNEEPWILRVDEQGEIIYSRVLGTGSINSVVELEEGNQIVCSNYSMKSALFLIDSEGNILNEQSIDYADGDDRITSIQILDDGRVVLGGRANAHTEAGDFWLVLLGEDNTAGINDLFKDGVKLYPNPTNDYLNINIEGKINSVKISDVNGKIVMNHKVNQSSALRLNVQSLTPGVYFVEIATANKTYIKKLIIK